MPRTEIRRELNRIRHPFRIAIDRAKKVFKAQFANVQPHSGSQANSEVFMALL